VHRFVLLTLLLPLAPSQVFAQPSGTLDRFRASETPEDDFHLSRPDDFGDLRFGAQLHLDYGANPLVYESELGDAGSESLSIVEHQLVGTLGLSLGLADRVVIYAGLPVALVNQGADEDELAPLGVPAADGPGLGDAYVGARVRLFGEHDDIGALAIQARATFPTAGVPNDAVYRGDPFLTVQPELLLEIRPVAGLRIVGNFGARLREETTDDDVNLAFRHELTYGLGVSAALFTDAGDPNTHLDLLIQIYGASAFAMVGEREGTALEATGGFKFFHGSGFTVGLAAGPGLNRGFGSPDMRGVLMVGWMMPRPHDVDGDRDGDGILDSADACPDEAEDVDQFEDTNGCPDPDNDADGILDGADACINEPETQNGHEDTDGCPDELLDTDGDGISDPTDECDDQPEDVDTFQDADGCPDPDNDGDGLLDTADRCPLQAGPPANQGCPDTDRDGDTVVDRLDNCPDEPGTVENHGCQAAQQVVIADGRLEILDAVYFRTNAAVIQSRSFALLENVARVINAHPEITLIRVEGHTDSRGRREHNVQLSQSRAEAVVTFLVERGHVEASRLEAQGFGPDRPVVENARNAADHARNRRVEFNIPNRSDIQNQNSGPSADTIDR
jgi:outer membrane protein OmpA-like peptidoglycan-associated protein